MAGNAGSLVVSLGLDGAEFFAGLSKAEYEAKKSMAAIASAASTLQNTFRNLGVGLSIAGIEQLVEGAVKAQAELGRLAERAGTTVEELSSMRVAAHEGGVGMDEIALAATRLSKAIFEGQDNTTKASQALELLGLKAKDLAKLPTGQALQAVAGSLDKFAESAGKTAVEMEILGRSGPKMGAFLKAIAENGTVAASVTTEMANAAREAEAKFFTLTDALDTLRTKGVNQLLPALNSIVEAFIEMQKTNDGTLGFWQAFGEALRVAALGLVTLYEITRSFIQLQIASVKIQKDIATFNLSGAIEEWNKYETAIDSNLTALNKFYGQLAKGSPLFAALAGADSPLPKSINDRSAQYKGDPYYGQGGGKRQIGNLPVTSSGALDDPSRKILEAALAALKANTEQEKAVLENRNQFLQAVFDRGELSVESYYAAKQAAQAEDLRITSQNYLDELALIDTFIKNAKTERDKAQGEKEKVAATARQQLAVIQAAGKAQQTLDEQQRALSEYLNVLDEVNAKMLELQGNTEAAARIRFDRQNDQLRSRLNSVIADPASTSAAVEAAKAAKDQLDSIEKITVAQARLNDVTARYSNIIGVVGVAQGRIDLLAQTGAITEIDAINKKAELAQQYIGVLSQEADAAQKVAEGYAVGSKQRADALLTVAQLRLQIGQLAAASDVLAKKFNDIFASGFSTFLTDIVSHTKSVKQAFLDMAKSIEQSISKIAADQVSQQLFGKGGTLGGVGDFFAGIFGGGKKTGAVGADASVAALATSATSADAGLVSLTAALGTASSAALAFAAAASAGGTGSGLGSFFGSGDSGGLAGIFGPGAIFGFAGGGSPPVGRWSVVGENGPELFMPKTAGTVIPIDKYRNASGGNQTIIVNVPSGTSRASANQIAVATAQRLEIAKGRNR